MAFTFAFLHVVSSLLLTLPHVRYFPISNIFLNHLTKTIRVVSFYISIERGIKMIGDIKLIYFPPPFSS